MNQEVFFKKGGIIYRIFEDGDRWSAEDSSRGVCVSFQRETLTVKFVHSENRPYPTREEIDHIVEEVKNLREEFWPQFI